MKTMKIKTLTMLVLAVMFSLTMNAQPPRHGMGQGQGYGNGHGTCMIPDLTEEQEAKLDALRVPHQKEMLALRNQIQEKQAHLQTLRTADKADMAAINKTIDEIGAIKVEKMKKAEAHKQEVRKILTEEQRIAFDMHSRKGGKGHGMGQGKGMHGNGAGYGHGGFHGKCDGTGPHGVVTE